MDVFCIQRGEKRSTTRTTQKLIRAKTRPRGRSLCMRKSATLSADTAENEQRFAEILTKCWQNTDSRATSRELAPCGGDQLSAATRKVPKMSARRTCCCTPTAYLHLDSNVFVMLLSSKFVGLNLDTCKKCSVRMNIPSMRTCSHFSIVFIDLAVSSLIKIFHYPFGVSLFVDEITNRLRRVIFGANLFKQHLP